MTIPEIVIITMLALLLAGVKITVAPNVLTTIAVGLVAVAALLVLLKMVDSRG